MNLKASFIKKEFYFQKPAGTSRGVYREKQAYFVLISDEDNPVSFGIGEASPLPGLSIDAIDNFEEKLQEICEELNAIELEIFEFNIPIMINHLIPNTLPSIKFGFETAMLDFLNGQKRIIFDNDFSKGKQKITINGLVWMNDFETMKAEIHQKVKEGYRTIKIKVGAIDFEDELALLHEIRDAYGYDIEIRLDANGAFDESNVYQKLNALSDFRIHSIEQPIKPKNLALMAKLCKDSPIKIALDEELIGITDYIQKMNLLKTLKPPFIILKPTLLGGFQHCREWIEICNRLDIQWWITSALETNIGLNAIAQFAATFDNILPQGLGTGQLYKQNVTSPLVLDDGFMTYNQELSWDFTVLGV
jgi:o-succinylbenzoate synthase